MLSFFLFSFFVTRETVVPEGAGHFLLHWLLCCDNICVTGKTRREEAKSLSMFMASDEDRRVAV